MKFTYDPILDNHKLNFRRFLFLFLFLIVWVSGLWAGVLLSKQFWINQGRKQLGDELSTTRPDGSLHPAMLKAFPQWFSGLKDSIAAREIICGKDYRKK